MESLAKIFSQSRKSESDHSSSIALSSPCELIASNEEHLSNYPRASKKSVVFDKYQDIAAKDYDRI